MFYDSPVRYLQERFPNTVDPRFPPSPHPTSIPGVPASSYSLTSSHSQAQETDLSRDHRGEGGQEASSRSSVSSSTSHVLFRDDWKHTWPQYLVMFGALLKEGNEPKEVKGDDMNDVNNSNVTVQALLLNRQYRRVWRTWNGFEEDEKRRGGIEVWRWQGHDRSDTADIS